MTTEIQSKLFELQDKKYRDFQSGLIPGVDGFEAIGVRTPDLRKYAKELVKREGIEELEKFLPYVNNWATCDQMSPKVFKKHKNELLKYIEKWMKSKETYTIRFAIGMLMQHFLDEDFDPKYLKAVSKIKSDEYYINMMIAWYFATALAKQYESVLPYLEERKLADWVHNKAIQKSVESYRISDEQKAYLKTLKVRQSR